MDWASRQMSNRTVRHAIVSLQSQSRVSSTQFNDDYDDDYNNDRYLSSPQSARDRISLMYTPRLGTHWFWFKGWPVMFTRSKKAQDHGRDLEEVTLRYFQYRPSMLRDLLEEAYREYRKREETKTMIHRASKQHYGASWQRCMQRPPRGLHTIVTYPGLKESVIDDITDYLSPETQSWYSNCGIPWKRGYLFAGPPGTGKTSFSLALAGHFQLRIYTLSLSSKNATDENLAQLFESLPGVCIVLLEDIDAVGLTSSRADPGSGVKATSSNKGTASLSGLLNLLDGTASQEGRILIMTTNHAEHLDKALLRPGRVDMTVNFTLSDRTMSAAIFRHIFSNLSKEAKSQNEAGLACQSSRRTSSQIEDLSEKFAAKIPQGEFTTAELQGYLITHKGEPEAAVDGAQDWVKKTRIDRSMDKNEDGGVPVTSQECFDDSDSDSTGQHRRKRRGKGRSKGRGKGRGKDMSLEEILGT